MVRNIKRINVNIEIAAESEKCDLDGILCLNNNVAEYIGQKTKWGDNIGLLCDCLPACNDAQYNTVTSTSKE